MLEGRNKNDIIKKLPKKRGAKGERHLFDFVVFRNYDGSQTGKAIPREVYNKLLNRNV
jgi:hypothetical protein